MRQASVVVTHGGHGTVMRALKHRLPMLIIPHGRDQDENAVRVVERGAGLRLAATATQEEIEAALQRLITEPAFAQAAQRLGNAIDKADDASVIDILEGFAAPRRSSIASLATLIA
jgi:UDP:flavonoid glycosyltransferase YjiC (YdhE family)